MSDNEKSSNNESLQSKKSSMSSEEEDDKDEHDDNKINENSIKNQSSIFDLGKNNTKSKNNISNNINNNSNKNQYNLNSENGNIRKIIKNKIDINNKKYENKYTQKSNQKLSSLLSNQKERNNILKEYNEILKSDEEDKNKELLKIIKDLEEKLSSSNKIINNLNNNKDIVIQRLTKTK